MTTHPYGSGDASETVVEVEVAVIGAGQAGLAAGRALQQVGLSPLILEAADRAGGSWPRYYDSLTLFSPARFSALPGLRLPGPQRRYPTRDELAGYLQRYAEEFALPVRTGTRVDQAHWDGHRFAVDLGGGGTLTAEAVVAASGWFGAPVVPDLPGATGYTGRLLHAATYRRPDEFAGQRVVVVGAGNSAVQIAVELAAGAQVSLATRAPVRFVRQAPLGVDLHCWTRWSGLEALPLGRRAASLVGVLDDGRYAAAVAAGRPDRRPMFTRLTPTGVVWADGTAEDVDAVILATGYRPALNYLTGTGALNPDGWPVHCRGISLTVPRLGYVGLPGQTGFASATVRGVGGDARRVARQLHQSLTRNQVQPADCRVPALADA
jgi:putative flavoprotein involved in K+ transport